MYYKEERFVSLNIRFLALLEIRIRTLSVNFKVSCAKSIGLCTL